MPSVKEHIPLAVVTIVLSIAMFILFREVRGIRGHVTALAQQAPVAYFPQLSTAPASTQAVGETTAPAAPAEEEEPPAPTPLPPKVTSTKISSKAKPSAA
jgi:predicted lipid-binding transport protein (Tim44 family)